MSLQQLAADLLLAVKRREDATPLISRLARLPVGVLKANLSTDEQKKAFWINCYNAFFLHLRRDQGVEKPTIYRNQLCRIAGQDFSLDEIEHGILRRYRAKRGAGFLPNLFTPRHIRKLAVDRIDFRIHFALNCGAISCPPIAFYTPEQIDQQLEIATTSFLENDTWFEPEKNEVHFSRLGLWYLGDFGGPHGIRKIVQHYLKVGQPSSQIIFNDYNWEENLDNFVDYQLSTI
ncbi:MAG: DUF547 domain-containing protein [Bacteroidota bacterium]